MPGGVLDSGNRHLVVDPNVRDQSFREMEDLLVGAGTGGTPVRLRDLANLSRGYESPPRYLNYLVSRDRDGRWQRNRAITLAIQMRAGEQIGKFGAAVDQTIESVRRKFPPDLIIARTSDQPLQVKEKSTSSWSAYEAIALSWSSRSSVLELALTPSSRPPSR
jgi:multidrug efflux pump subunit AcrB